MNHIRNSIKAIIVKDNCLLVTKNRDSDGVFYLLPGGGQRHGETMHSALKRECKEEVGVEVKIQDLVFIREYIGRNHEFSKHDFHAHQIEHMFRCEISDNAKPCNGTEPDEMQEDVSWIPLQELSEYRIYPSILKEILKQKAKHQDMKYLGDVN